MDDNVMIRDTDLQATTTPGMNYTACYQLPFVSLFNEDCSDTIKRIPDKSIDLLLQDLPYGTTQNEWDKVPNLHLITQLF
jgi:hypothetical protein